MRPGLQYPRFQYSTGLNFARHIFKEPSCMVPALVLCTKITIDCMLNEGKHQWTLSNATLQQTGLELYCLMVNSKWQKWPCLAYICHSFQVKLSCFALASKTRMILHYCHLHVQYVNNYYILCMFLTNTNVNLTFAVCRKYDIHSKQ